MPLGCQAQQTPKWFLCPMYQGLHVVLGPCGEGPGFQEETEKVLVGSLVPGNLSSPAEQGGLLNE